MRPGGERRLAAGRMSGRLPTGGQVRRDVIMGVVLVTVGMAGLLFFPAFRGYNGSGWPGWGWHGRMMVDVSGVEVKNPLPRTDSVLARGRWVYETFCASCHGIRGWGDGPAAAALFPPPPALAAIARVPALPDGYLFQRIREGGRLRGTAMPAFDSLLTEEDIWSVVAYLREGFPDVARKGPGAFSPKTGGVP